MFESHLKDEYSEEEYGYKKKDLNDCEIVFGFVPYLEKRILGRMRDIFKDYIPNQKN